MIDNNITRNGAQHRSTVVQADSYRVLMDLSGNGPDGKRLESPETTFVSTSTVVFNAKDGSTNIDIVADQLLAAFLDGKALDISKFTGATLPFEVKRGQHELTIIALCRYSNSGEGLHRFVDPVDHNVYLYSQFESADARRAYACFDQPDQKAKFQFSVIAPLSWVVFSNSPSVSPVDLGNNLGRWDFAETLPISTYITAIVAGNYKVHRGELTSVSGQIPANIVSRQSMAEYTDAETILDITQKGLKVFEKYFGYPYPFASYDQIFVPEFNFGAMENAGCVTFRDQYLFRSRVTNREYAARANTILHELAHMWFGNLVTMRWWDDLWLNESFAEWASHFAQAEIAKTDQSQDDPWVSFANERKTWAYTQDQLPTTHPIAADMVDLDAVEQNFDGITYAKGASVLKLLVNLVGKDNFLAGVRAYFKEFAFSNTELTDLLNQLTKASGRDLSWFAGQWLETAGVNTLSADFELDNQGNFRRFDIIQTAQPNWPTLRTHRLGIGFFTLQDGILTRTDHLEVDISAARTPIAALIGKQRPDLVLLNDGDSTYAKTRLDPHSLQTAIDYLGTLTDPLARAMIWAIAWDMTRDGELTSRDYVRLATNAIASENDQTAVSTVLRQALTAATTFTAPELRSSVRGELVTGLAKLLKHAQPGSDTQVSVVRTLAGAVFTEPGKKLIRGWLHDEEVPEGLQIDTDMRWVLTTALARLGVITAADIEAEAQHDQTNTGIEKAAGALAALKDADAKKLSWQRATADSDVPNETHRQICQQFFQFDQDELLKPYLNRYLEVLQTINDKTASWATRGTAAREAVLNYLFPSPLADQDFINQLKSWLASGASNDQLIRGIREQIDTAERALRCQEKSRDSQ